MAASGSILQILAIHAHPDDVEITCSGVLFQLQELGHNITIVTMTPGDCGSAEYDAEEIAAIRRNEAKQAAEFLGANYLCAEFRDLSILVDRESRQRVTEILRRVQPDIVFTAPPIDYMSDHEMTSHLVRDACFAASVPNYTTHQWDPAPPTNKIPWLYYVDPIEGIDYFGNPIPAGFILDISSYFQKKREMLSFHQSQRNWLKQQHGMDEYLDSCERWSAARGQEIGVEYGEGFRQHLGHPFPQDNTLQTLLQS